MLRRMSWSERAIVVVMTIAVLGSLRYRVVGDNGRAWQSAINNDGKGYYEHLRAPLVEGRLDGEHGEPWMFARAGEGKVIKYFAGTALLQSPYVLAAHAYTVLFSRGPQDGYSLQYHLAIICSALVSLCLGLIFTRRLLLAMGHGEVAAAFALVAIGLGTGLLVQAVVHPGMSHVHSFAAVAALLWTSRRAWEQPSWSRYAIVGAALGLVIILRPVDLLVVGALPLATLGLARPSHLLRLQNLIAFALALGALLMVQSTLWYIQCGEWLIRPYAGEGFHWDRPAIMQHLFSARNGLLFYWPVLLLVIPGAWMIIRRHPVRAFPFIMCLLGFAYVTSAWWNWSYGDSFGQRPYVDVMALLALPIAAVMGAGRAWRTVLLVVGTLAILLNLFQSWQYANWVLVPARIDLVRYGHVFLRTDAGRARELGGLQELPPYAPQGMVTVLDVTTQWQPDADGHMVWVMPHGTQAPGLWFLELDIRRTNLLPGAAHDASVHLSGSSTGWSRAGIRFGLDHVPDPGATSMRWNNSAHLPPQQAGDTLRLHVDHAAGCRIDALEVRVFAPR